jgi:hypothetical protein
MFARQFIEVTSHKDKTPTIIPVAKIAFIFTLADRDQLADGKCAIILEAGIRIPCSESLAEIKSMLGMTTH